MLVLYENFAADYETSTLNLLERLDLSPPEDFEFEPRMKRQSDRINDDWIKRYSELQAGQRLRPGAGAGRGERAMTDELMPGR